MSLLDFGDLDLILKVTGILKCPKYGLCAYSYELVIGFGPKCIDTLLGGEEGYQILVALT